MPPNETDGIPNKTVMPKTKTIFQKSQNHQRGPISQTYSDESANSGEDELSSGGPTKDLNSAHHLQKYDDETLMAMSGDGSLPSMGQDG